MQEKLVEQNCKNLGFDNDLLNTYLRLLVYMYANDTVLLCDSESNMNQTLTSLHRYCSKWKIKVNCNKTKIMVISRGQVQTRNFNFNLGGEEIQVVSDYEYLGILSNYNGRFRKGELELVRKATRALYSVTGTPRKYDLPIDIQIDLFNTMVVAVLTYGCEIRGDNIIREMGLLHAKHIHCTVCCWSLPRQPAVPLWKELRAHTDQSLG